MAVQLNWTPQVGAASYKVYRGPVVGGETLLQANVATASFLDTTTEPGNTYWYVVKAMVAAAEIHSNEVVVMTVAWRDGNGPPANSLGNNGDYYLNDGPIATAGDVYAKASGAWGLRTSILGPTGATGATGAAGATGPPGAPGSGIGIVVTDYPGIAGDGSDCYTAWQALIAALALAGTKPFFWVPAGVYRFSSTLDFSALGSWEMEGAGADSTILGNDTIGSGVCCQSLANIFRVRGIHFRGNTASSGTGFYSNNTNNCCFLSCTFSGVTGMYAQDPFMTAWINCAFNGQGTGVGSNIGLIVDGATACFIGGASDFSGWNEGLRACGTGVSLYGVRFEVNVTGMRLGADHNGNNFTLTRSAFHGISMEANDTHIFCQGVANSSFAAIGAQGSGGAPSGSSKIGMRLDTAAACTFSAVNMGGGYDTAAIQINNNVTYTTFDSVTASNGGVGATWSVKQGLVGVSFRNCNFQIRTDDTVSPENLEQHGTFDWLGQLNYLAPMVEGRNLGQRDVAVGAGLSTKAVAFTVDHNTFANCEINGASATTGGSLAGTTYYLLGAVATAHGVVAGTSEKTVVVGGSNNAIAVSFQSSSAADGFRRRIYVGTTSGVYDGYFERPLNSDASYTVINTTYTAKGGAPASGIDVTSMIEPDANYAVSITPSWLTTCRVTNKATTGFTVDFGTVAPGGGGTFDWLLARVPPG